MSVCQIHQKYPWIKCTNPALDGDPDGCCILHSQNPEKDPQAFREALQARWADEDAEYYDFRAVFFADAFHPRVFLGTREFTKRAAFSNATFAKNAIFFKTTFTENAIFSGATFIMEAYFIEATFTRRADFSRATFTAEAFFSEATFTAEADFSRVIIEGQVVFRALNPPEEGKPPPPAFQGVFRNLELSPEAVLRFQDLSLARSQFTGTDLRRVEFHHVAWNNYHGRQALYDEVLLRLAEKKEPVADEEGLAIINDKREPVLVKRKDPWFRTWLLRHAPYADPPAPWPDRYGEVERLYRELQENYEKARDYKKMGDFHYGEMEMHRRASKWRWFPFSWYNLYWVLSGYGERPARALAWLAAFLALFTAFLAWTGLEIYDPKHVPAFGDSFFYLLQKVTLQRPEWAAPRGFWGKLTAGLSVLLLPGQTALFILALRNRLGRRR